jgi:hypothetical protein
MLIVQADEFRTSSYCPCCNGKLAHPADARGSAIKGTLYCPNNACFMAHTFHNRDTLAALTIGVKFVWERVVGGYAGAFSRWSAPSDSDSSGSDSGSGSGAAGAAGVQVCMESVNLLGYFLPADGAVAPPTTTASAPAPEPALTFSSKNIKLGRVPSSLRALLKQLREARAPGTAVGRGGLQQPGRVESSRVVC